MAGALSVVSSLSCPLLQNHGSLAFSVIQEVLKVFKILN
jgi:hypothetical protein